jgi:predicted RNA-binding protein with TRAM domain
MLELYLAVGGGVLVVGVAAVALRRASDASESRRAHEAAHEREPPVELGETDEFGVAEFTDHHAGTRVAIGTVGGGVISTEDVPDDVEVGDVIRAEVPSFDRGRTSADVRIGGRA